MSEQRKTPADRKAELPEFFPRSTKVEMETSESGCFIAHVEDDTGEYVVLQTERDEQQP